MTNSKKIGIIGYSGHAYVICDIFLSNDQRVDGYFESEEKPLNPYQLQYFGYERNSESLKLLETTNYFVAVGDNHIRKKITEFLTSQIKKLPLNAIHANASISSTAKLKNGIMVGDGAIITACATIENGVICNTQSVIEHECTIGAFSHIAPGVVLCGNVSVGENTFIGARSVVREGIKIGKNVIIGAGTVVIRDIPDGSKVVGNPQKFI